jgi:mRNA interferase HigB
MGFEGICKCIVYSGPPLKSPDISSVTSEILTPWTWADRQAANWKNPQGIKRRFRHASLVADNRIIFNIGGNKYRLAAHVNYELQIVYIKFVGTHAEYDRVDAEVI